MADKTCQPFQVASSSYSLNLNCKSQDTAGVCISCRTYYTLSEGDCIPTG